MTVRQKRERIQARNSRKQMRGAYTYGNVAIKAAPKFERKSVIREVEGKNVKRSRRRSTGINAGYVVFMTAMLFIVGAVCMGYLNITSSITSDLTKIAGLEAEYNSLKAENDDYENRINGSIDLENIKKRAMNDLGMQYANDDQIVLYESDDTDYVRQYISLE